MPTVVDICEKQVVTLILLPLPPLKAEPKLLLRTFTDIVTALKTGVDIPLTPQMCLLIKNEEELYHLARINPKFVKNIFSMKTLPRPHVTFNFLLSIAQSKSPLVNELAYSLNCVELINNSSQFLKIAAVNLKMALNLLNFKPIEELTRGILHLIPFEMLLERYQFNNPGIKNHHLKKLKSMDLHISDPLREKTSLVKKEAALIKKRRMDMEIDLLSSRHRFMKKTFPRVAEYKNQMMFGDSGYYSKGLVTFGSGNNSGRTDFTTVPSDETIAPAFAAAFAHQLISIRTNLIAIGELSCEARFNVLECGAGNGDLCYHILNFIGKMAANYPLWEELNERIRYHIIERSPKLIERQQSRNKIFGDKLVLINADARHLQSALNKTKNSKKMAAVISNELIDVFPADKVIRLEDGSYAVGFVMPLISLESLRYLHDLSISELHQYYAKEKMGGILHPKREAIEAFENYITKSNQYRLRMGLSSSDLLKMIILSFKDYSRLHKIATDQLALSRTPVIDREHFKFKEFHLNSKLAPTMDRYIKINEQFFEKMSVGSVRYISLGIESYLKDVSDVLLPSGEVITVDYGNNDDLISNIPRTYKNGQIGFDIFSRPGEIDITMDVPFTTLMRLGKFFGLQPVFFGQQQQLLPADSCKIPATVVSTRTLDKFIAMSEKNTFQVCVQRKALKGGPSFCEYEKGRFFGAGKLGTDLELFDGYKAELAIIRYYIELLTLVKSCLEKNDLLIPKLILNYLMDRKNPYKIDVRPPTSMAG